MKACFMGLGYIGLPTAVIAAKEGGVDVVGVDINPSVVEQTNAGHLHIVEPGMETMLQEVVSAGKLHASSTPEVADAYFMVVPTPFKGNHEPDVSYVEAATRAVLPLFKEGDLYVIESTSPVGTTEAMSKIIFSERPELKGKISVAYEGRLETNLNADSLKIRMQQILNKNREDETVKKRKWLGRSRQKYEKTNNE